MSNKSNQSNQYWASISRPPYLPTSGPDLIDADQLVDVVIDEWSRSCGDPVDPAAPDAVPVSVLAEIRDRTADRRPFTVELPDGYVFDAEPADPEPYGADDVAEFADGYVDGILWANTYASDGADPEPSDPDPAELSPRVLAELIDDARTFATDPDVAELLARAAMIDPSYTPMSAGIDYALTRNGHGAGYWDRGLGDVGNELSEHASTYGSAYILADGVDPELWDYVDG